MRRVVYTVLCALCLSLVGCSAPKIPTEQGWKEANVRMQISVADNRGWRESGVLAWKKTKDEEGVAFELRETQYTLPSREADKTKTKTLHHHLYLRAKLGDKGNIKGFDSRLRTPDVDERTQLDGKQYMRYKGVERLTFSLSSKHTWILPRVYGIIPTGSEHMAFWVLIGEWLQRHRTKMPGYVDVQFLRPRRLMRWQIVALPVTKVRWRGRPVMANRWFLQGRRSAATCWFSPKGELLQIQTMSTRLKRKDVELPTRLRRWEVGKYTSADVDITGGATKPLKGTLTFPKKDAKKKLPGIVLIHGSGTSDRDGNGPGRRTDVFRKLAQRLSAKGFVVLRFDKMGSGESGLPPLKRRNAEAEFDDVEAATRTLQKHPRVDSRCVGLLGHSQGGWIAPMIAQRVKGIRSIAAMGGPVRKAIDLLTDQMQYTLKNIDASPRERRHAIAAQAYFMKKVRLYIQQRKYDAETKKKKGQKASIHPGRGMFSSDAVASWRKALAKLSAAGAQKRWVAAHSYPDPVERLRQLNVPMFFLYGGKDFQVPPGPELKVLKSLTSKQKLVETKVIKGVDHLFTKVTGVSTVASYYDPRKEMDDRAIDAFIQWFGKTLRCP